MAEDLVARLRELLHELVMATGRAHALQEFPSYCKTENNQRFFKFGHMIGENKKSSEIESIVNNFLRDVDGDAIEAYESEVRKADPVMNEIIELAFKYVGFAHYSGCQDLIVLNPTSDGVIVEFKQLERKVFVSTQDFSVSDWKGVSA